MIGKRAGFIPAQWKHHLRVRHAPPTKGERKKPAMTIRPQPHAGKAPRKAPARLLVEYDSAASLLRYEVHFPAPSGDEAPLVGPARLELHDGSEIDLGMLCAPSPETWAASHTLPVAERRAPVGAEVSATLVWGAQEIAGVAASTRPGVTPDKAAVALLKSAPVADNPLAVVVEFEIGELENGLSARMDGGAGNIAWVTADNLRAEEGRTHKAEWTFHYAKPGEYTLSVDLVDDLGFWVETAARRPLEIAPPIDEPESATSPGARPDSLPATASAPVEVAAQSAAVPWLPFRYARPLWAWTRTYTQPGGAVISRYLALGTAIAIRQEVTAGGALWYQTGSYDWIPASSVAFLNPSELRGVQLAGTGPDPEPEPEPEPEPDPDKARKGVVTANVLNVRSGPGVQYPVVDQLRANAEVTIVEEATVSGATWYRIGAQRWVHGGWIRLVATGPTPPPPGTRRGIVSADVLNVRARPGVRADNPPVDRLRRGAQVQIYEEAQLDGATWYRIGVNRWVHGGWVQVVADDSPIQLALCPQPLRESSQPALPVGWVVTETLIVRAEPGLHADNSQVGTVYHNQVLNILETRVVAGQRWYRIGDERWVYGANVGVARFRARPSAIRSDERWVGVNLREQTAVAYEGDKPVYAALVATGMAATPTVQGIFRTWWRLVSRKMAGGSASTGGYYYLEEVPWTCYFYSGYALHAAYWHDAFGRPRSHGCVNLSPYDAWWIFQWSEAGGPKSPAVYVYWE